MDHPASVKNVVNFFLHLVMMTDASNVPTDPGDQVSEGSAGEGEEVVMMLITHFYHCPIICQHLQHDQWTRKLT